MAEIDLVTPTNGAMTKRPLVSKVPATGAYTPQPLNVWGLLPRDLPPFTFMMIRAMLWEPTIRLGLAMRFAPLANAELAYQDPSGQWLPGVECEVPQVKAYLDRQFRTFWQGSLYKIAKAQIWGWSGGEIMYKQEADGSIGLDTILTRHAADVRALQSKGKLCGVRFRRVPQVNPGYIDLPFPEAFWHSFFPEDGSEYGISILRGCYSPWCDKWLEGMALDIRRLFMHKDAYGGVDIAYPEGSTNLDDKGATVPNRDVAREIAEQIKSGGVTARPSVLGPNNEQMWTITRATVPPNPSHIFQFPKDCDVEILRGMEIPDDVLTSENGGAWAGKAVPQQAFYNGLDNWGNVLVTDWKTQIGEPMVLANFGQPIPFRAGLKPLAQQAGEAQQPTQAQGAELPQQVQMALWRSNGVQRSGNTASTTRKEDHGTYEIRHEAVDHPPDFVLKYRPNEGEEEHLGKFRGNRSALSAAEKHHKARSKPTEQKLALDPTQEEVAEELVGAGVLGATGIVRLARAALERRATQTRLSTGLSSKLRREITHTDEGHQVYTNPTRGDIQGLASKEFVRHGVGVPLRYVIDDEHNLHVGSGQALTHDDLHQHINKHFYQTNFRQNLGYIVVDPKTKKAVSARVHGNNVEHQRAMKGLVDRHQSSETGIRLFSPAMRWALSLLKQPQGDLSGWVTPAGKHLKHVGSHAATLKINKIKYAPDEAIQQGFIWVNHDPTTKSIELDCRPNCASKAVRWVKQNGRGYVNTAALNHIGPANTTIRRSSIQLGLSIKSKKHAPH